MLRFPLSYLGTTWGLGTPRFTTEQVLNFTHKVTAEGGAVTWDTPVELNGTLSHPFKRKALGAAFR
jgi:hypothetical protein